MDSLFESVPNISQGRDPALLASMKRQLESAGVRVLDSSADPDHNRAVMTLAGHGTELETGLVGLAELAVAHIDLSQHTGEHPFVGALDVVPIVPLLGARRADAVRLAERVAERLARELALPIYLYEWAARRPERRNLADIRRGGYASLAARMMITGAEPDMGPSRPHPTAGATVVGARGLLIAFNVILDTPELLVAKRAARAVRESSGGLAAVKAIAVWLSSRGLAQVSMNLVDFRRTDLPTAFAAVRREVERLGHRVLESEVIGLAPRAAFGGAQPEADLLMTGFHPAKELETALEAAF